MLFHYKETHAFLALGYFPLWPFAWGACQNDCPIFQPSAAEDRKTDKQIQKLLEYPADHRILIFCLVPPAL